ncbi:DUF2851 family protein [Dyadobacter sp. CY326]|uniref:DUF2851 family protein n=1 Tax=Dyadobacter sp. CY326 TaxID=2907300 RepID=UPI001F29D64B|nr:DUF2851 family protein [Dyadobacter sp. CY326]MCE7063670.1 DUF2851 family protein [Dyadobacter sp. CY326]
MNEDILSFIWRFQYFASNNLKTDEGLPLTILRTGHRNGNSGPDFSEARVVIDNVQWIGNVEIHVKSSDWSLHNHEKDAAYETVVLHVVWENDRPVVRRDGTLLPTLTLKDIVTTSVLERYRHLQDETETIPCAALFAQVPDIQKFNMLDRVLLERLDKKAAQVMQLFENNNSDWEETAYQWLGKHFGFKQNDAAFIRLTGIVTWKIVRRHRGKLLQTEALLFGCAGLIPKISDQDYVNQLRIEFQFLKAKYALKEQLMSGHEWKNLRMRPAGFPTVRLAQFAAILSRTTSLFSEIISASNFADLQALFHAEQSEYWQAHYLFGKKSKSKVPFLGKDASNLLIINAAVPLLVAYARHRQQSELLDKAISWLSEINAENNRIMREWGTLGMKVKTAADSQSLIEWYNNYCTFRKCLECTVGAALVRAPSALNEIDAGKQENGPD